MLSDAQLNELKRKVLKRNIDLGFGEVERTVSSSEIVVNRAMLLELITELEFYRNN